MSYRLFESTSGPNDIYVLCDYKYNNNEWIDVNIHKQYIIYRGMKLPLSFVTSQQQDLISHVGFVPHKIVEKRDYFKTNQGQILFVYVFNFNQFELSSVQFGGKEYRFQTQPVCKFHKNKEKIDPPVKTQGTSRKKLITKGPIRQKQRTNGVHKTKAVLRGETRHPLSKENRNFFIF